jgi:hypothetical protein
VRLPRNAHLWLPGYLRSRFRARADKPPHNTPIDVLFCVADHYEPDHGKADLEKQRRRIRRWATEYPALARRFKDADGVGPQHTFFSPLEEYCEDHLDELAAICHAGHGEVEVHLHHGHDTAANLRARLIWFRETLIARHGLLGIDQSGRGAYGFIHGNWALDNGRLDPQFCGVNNELSVLRETGCYADFTMPAGFDPAQSRIVNALYYAVDDPTRPRSYDSGARVLVGRHPDQDALAMIQGPFRLEWKQRIQGVLPRVDSGALDSSPRNRPTLERFRRWVDARITVRDRPEWVFVKVHTHGAKDANADVLLGEPMYQFHEEIGRHFNDGTRYRLHYVTAREMYNVMKAAEAGCSGDAGRFRNYLIKRSSKSDSAASSGPRDRGTEPTQMAASRFG